MKLILCFLIFSLILIEESVQENATNAPTSPTLQLSSTLQNQIGNNSIVSIPVTTTLPDNQNSTSLNPTAVTSNTSSSILNQTLSIIYTGNSISLNKSINPICDGWRRTLDEAGKKLLILGDRDLVIPTTVEEVDVFCKRADDALKTMRNIVRLCFRPFAKQVGVLALNGAKKAQRSLCNIGRKRKELTVEDGKCINTPEKRETMHRIIDDVIRFAEEIRSDAVEVNMKMTYVCCYYKNHFSNSAQTFLNFCPKAAVERTMKVFHIMMEDVFDLTCSDTEGTNKCVNIFKNKPLNIDEKRPTEAESPLLPLLDIYTIVGNVPTDDTKLKI